MASASGEDPFEIMFLRAKLKIVNNFINKFWAEGVGDYSITQYHVTTYRKFAQWLDLASKGYNRDWAWLKLIGEDTRDTTWDDRWEKRTPWNRTKLLQELISGPMNFSQTEGSEENIVASVKNIYKYQKELMKNTKLQNQDWYDIMEAGGSRKRKTRRKTRRKTKRRKQGSKKKKQRKKTRTKRRR
jgi:hypothetical protein